MSAPVDRAERMSRLLDEYSFVERRSPELLQAIEGEVTAALASGEVARGRTAADIRSALGEPYRSLGGEQDRTFDWHYPRAAPSAEEAGDDWFLALRFRDGRLDSIATRIWREGR